MAVMFPLDDDGHPIPVLGFDYRGTQKLAVGPTSARHGAPIPTDIEIVSLIATGQCRFEVGDASVTIADSAREIISTIENEPTRIDRTVKSDRSEWPRKQLQAILRYSIHIRGLYLTSLASDDNGLIRTSAPSASPDTTSSSRASRTPTWISTRWISVLPLVSLRRTRCT